MNPNSKKFKTISPSRLNSVLVFDGDVSYAIKAWKSLLKNNNAIQECYDRKFFKKPSEKRRLKNQFAKYIQTKEDLKNAD